VVLSDPSAFCPFYSPLYFHISIYFIQFVITVFLKNIGLSSSNTTIGHIVIYLDDILIFATMLDKLVFYMHKVLKRIQEVDLFLHPAKCSFDQTSVEYLGLIISEEELHMDPVKLQAVGLASPQISQRHSEVFRLLQLLQMLRLCIFYTSTPSF